ncbi:MAG: hypothetical protein U9N36_11900 [Euryarchaeota archaeon]|nr:hypothetical protein [Euryarchaeota archaeon]
MFSNIYIEDRRYAVDLCRSAKDLLESELHSRALGKQLRKEAGEGCAVLEGVGVVDAVDLVFLSNYSGTKNHYSGDFTMQELSKTRNILQPTGNLTAEYAEGRRGKING